MIGDRPPASRPDARAAWDHARLQADRYLARRLRELDDDALTDLHARMGAVIEARPTFDPSNLQAARQALDAAHRIADPETPRDAKVQRRLRRQVDVLEGARASHAAWRRKATEANDIRRRIELERRRRSAGPRRLTRTA